MAVMIIGIIFGLAIMGLPIAALIVLKSNKVEGPRRNTIFRVGMVTQILILISLVGLTDLKNEAEENLQYWQEKVSDLTSVQSKTLNLANCMMDKERTTCESEASIYKDARNSYYEKYIYNSD